MKTLAIIGFGQFGQLMAKHLAGHFEVFAYNRSDQSAAAQELGVTYCSLSEAATKDIVVLSLPVQHLEGCLREIAPNVRPETLVIDVCSVKLKPVELMLRYLPHNEIIATHPLFGPQSGKNGISGLRIVMCEVRSSRFDAVREFLEKELGLNVMLKTPQQHDQEMAYVQGLSHFISRGLAEMNIPDSEQKTASYQHLLDMNEMLKNDTWELFLTLENENPYARDVRKRFLQELQKIDEKLQ